MAQAILGGYDRARKSNSLSHTNSKLLDRLPARPGAMTPSEASTGR